ncbi:hypothetical protein [Xanthomonas oryzae]|nr:hypothetical protein [Xanthomonas oryzae]AGI07883.1 Hypothetical Protein XCAW_02094 [Xanthomonas citri subsp. citri Aw12879]EBA48548.1 conserved hypothetical protein [Burkholderia pseudomallei 305]CEE78419.1 conserved hypothetical protein [Xanthomonas citri pv. citri]MDI9069102.1 hypothetical protein [Xanthomonas oryzae pv. oryzae]MDI9079524.1 hypothetical protein [Xanthomonas oryzae pv. oryzae]
MKRGKAMPDSEPNCSPGSEKAMNDNYVRCGTPLVYTGELELRPDILAELGEQQSDQKASRSTDLL